MNAGARPPMRHGFPFAPVLVRTAALAALASLALSCSRAPAPRPDADVVVITVNGTPFPLRDLSVEILSMRGFAPSLESRSPTRAEVADAIRRLVEKAIVLQEGERRGVTVGPSEVEEEVRRLRADFPPGGLEKMLLQEGIDAETWRAELRRALLYRKAAEAIAASHAAVPEEDVAKAARRSPAQADLPERIRVRQMIFSSEDEARRAGERIRNGAEPERVVRPAPGHSLPALVDLGSFGREELPAELPEDLFALPEGGISRAVRHGGAVSLFQVVRREPARPLPQDAAVREIRGTLVRARREEALRDWLAAEIARADVKIQQELLDRLAEDGR
jgi:parvulin-like peptidyl-prolyl isomerase